MLALLCWGEQAVVNLLFQLLHQVVAPEDSRVEGEEAEEGLHRPEEEEAAEEGEEA